MHLVLLVWHKVFLISFGFLIFLSVLFMFLLILLTIWCSIYKRRNHWWGGLFFPVGVLQPVSSMVYLLPRFYSIHPFCFGCLNFCLIHSHWFTKKGGGGEEEKIAEAQLQHTSLVCTRYWLGLVPNTAKEKKKK